MLNLQPYWHVRVAKGKNTIMPSAPSDTNMIPRTHATPQPAYQHHCKQRVLLVIHNTRAALLPIRCDQSLAGSECSKNTRQKGSASIQTKTMPMSMTPLAMTMVNHSQGSAPQAAKQQTRHKRRKPRHLLQEPGTKPMMLPCRW